MGTQRGTSELNQNDRMYYRFWLVYLWQGYKEISKEMKEGKWDVVRHGVGLRPAREGGVRVEREEVDIAQGNVSEDGDRETNRWVVHDYGHAGEGYQMSVGCTQDAVELVEGIFRTR